MSQNKDKLKKLILIHEEAGVQTFRDPDTGKEISSTINRPIPTTNRKKGLVAVTCSIRVNQKITQQLERIRSAVGSDVKLSSHEMLAEAKSKGWVTIPGLRLWRAKEIVSALHEIGVSTILEQNEE